MPKNNSKRFTIKQTVTPYNIYLESNGRSQATIESYITSLKQFNDFIKIDLNNRIRYVNQLTMKEVELYKQHLLKSVKEGDFKPATVENKFSALKVYFHFLETLGLKDLTKGQSLGNKRTIRDMDGNKQSDLHKKILTEEQVDKIFEYLYMKKKDQAVRDRAIFEILYSTGCRKSELLALKWEDIDFRKREILLTRIKTSNSHILPLNKNTAEALISYYNANGLKCEYVFYASTDTSKPMSESSFDNIINSLKRKVSLPSSFTAHSFRHTFITTCLRNGIKSEDIIRFTGHASTSALKPYTHLVAEDLYEVADLFERKRAS